MIVVFIGPPGCGKGTQAAILSRELNIPNLSAGDLLRQRSQKQDEIGLKIRHLLSSGYLLPSDLVNETVANALQHFSDGILDGYPRTLDQAKFLENNIKTKFIFVYFKIDEEDLIKRIVGRFQCKECMLIYNKYFYPTKLEGVCDVCSNRDFVIRDDDKLEVLDRRLKEFNKSTTPLVHHYSKLSFVVDASKEQKKISTEIKNIIDRNF